MKETPSISPTAILLFIRTEEEEVRYKQLVRGGSRAKNLKVIRALNAHASLLAEWSDLPVEVVTSEAQRGNSFGERFVHAIEDVLAKGYESVIAIGNDCLGLQVEDLKSARRALQQQQLILGPALDGGAYLIGVHRDGFHPEDWKRLPWQQDDLFQSLLQLASKKGQSTQLLEVRCDVDDAKSFQNELCTIRWDQQPDLFLLLSGALFSRSQERFSRPEIAVIPNPITFYGGRGYRGPPVA
jgi:glycosyltransferase A (GT-A) superfamily protein (DUF2064 family)